MAGVMADRLAEDVEATEELESRPEYAAQLRARVAELETELAALHRECEEWAQWSNEVCDVIDSPATPPEKVPEAVAQSLRACQVVIHCAGCGVPMGKTQCDDCCDYQMQQQIEDQVRGRW